MSEQTSFRRAMTKWRLPVNQGWPVVAVFMLPALIGFLVLQLVPAIVSLYLSVTDWDIVSPPNLVGFQNFIDLFKDKTFIHAAGVTALVTVGLEIANTSLGILVALGLNRTKGHNGVYRTLFFLPLVTAWAAVALVWNYLYSTTGPINALIQTLGGDPINFLSSPSTALTAVLITVCWKSLGWKVIILLAGLQAIANEHYEAARIDGATARQQFFSITLPLLTPSIFVAVVVGIINTLQIFDPIYIMTQGGPAASTETVGYLVYTTGFNQLRMGYAAAMSWLLFIVIMAMTLLQWRLQKRWVTYE